MPKLNDTQRVLLAAAAQRDSGSLFPLPERLAKAGARVIKALDTLREGGFAEERETAERAAIRRTDGDIAYGLFVTPAGLAAIGIAEPGDAGEGSAPQAPASPPAAAEAPVTKSALVISLLQREEGATLAELIAATGWLPHTTRAALTGLRRKGYSIERSKHGEVTRYRIVAAA
jgi:hypothetical protein